MTTRTPISPNVGIFFPNGFKNSVGTSVHVYPFFLFCKFCENSEEPLCGNEMKRNAKQKWREFPWEQILEYWLGGCDDDNGDIYIMMQCLFVCHEK